MESKCVLELQHVSKIYRTGADHFHALRDVNIKIKRGEFVGLLGPSGCGKSTCMHIMGCLDTPTRGKVILDGKDASKLSEHELSRIRGQKIGFVFQTFNLIRSMTVAENLMLPMIFQNKSEEERRRRVDELLKLVELEDRANNRATDISGGEQQRTAVARALVNDPEIILADEPTGNLDSKRGSAIMSFFDKINKEGKTVIIVTHDREVAKHAKRTIHMRDGEVVGNG